LDLERGVESSTMMQVLNIVGSVILLAGLPTIAFLAMVGFEDRLLRIRIVNLFVAMTAIAVWLALIGRFIGE
jgi:hypothetical protein